MSHLPYRKVVIDGASYLQLDCQACGDEYLIHAAFGKVIRDTGLCVSCDSEVEQLESAYCNAAGGLL